MTARLTVFAFRVAWALIPRIPESVATRIFDALFDVLWLRNDKGVRRLQANLARVTGLPIESESLRALTRDGMRSYGRYWREMFSLSSWSDEEISRRLRIEGLEYLDQALAEGRGVMLAATHSGNWDLPGLWAGRRFGRVTTVAERLKPESLFDEFVARRTAYGAEILPHEGGAQQPFRVLLERLRAGGIVALVSDRDLTDRGIDVNFFGATARMAAGPAALARTTGAALLPVAVWNDGPVVVLTIHERLAIGSDMAVADICQRLADVFARDIAAHPQDWHMLQRVWVEGAR